MAYDRHETRDRPRDERSRWREERFEGRDERFGGRDRGYSPNEDRGFFERAGDEIASWFGDDEAERRRREDQRMEGRDRGSGGERDWRRDEDRGRFSERGEREGGSQFFAASGYGRGGFGPGDFERERGYGRPPRGDHEREWRPSGAGNTWQERQPRLREETPRSGYFASERSRGSDPHYESWRQRQLDELDRDYDDYRRENQARFESDFGSWRERRVQKRGLLSQIREHMEVVGTDDQRVGTIDRVAGDRIILAKSDPESGGAHHSLSCSDIDRVEGDRVVLDCNAEQAKQRWRDESRGRALFEREDQGEMGDRVLNRSFEGTYR